MCTECEAFAKANRAVSTGHGWWANCVTRKEDMDAVLEGGESRPESPRECAECPLGRQNRREGELDHRVVGVLVWVMKLCIQRVSKMFRLPVELHLYGFH